MAKQNNSLTELQALEGIYEHLSTIDNLSEEVGKLSTRLSKIEQAHNITLTTVTSFTKSMTQSFEEMKNTKSTEVPVSLCKTETVKTIVREQMTEALKGIDLKAEVSPEYYERMAPAERGESCLYHHHRSFLFYACFRRFACTF